MFNYNNLLKNINVDTRDDDNDNNRYDDNDDNRDDDNDNDNDLFEIKSKIIEPDEPFLDTILQYPFIDNMNISLERMKGEINVILYRIKLYKGFHIVEFYIKQDFITVILEENDADIYNKINEKIKDVSGIKKLKGNIQHLNSDFIFIQVKNNDHFNNWVTLWDIIVNHHYFGQVFDNHIINFFTSHNNICDLRIHKKICLKPRILYCNVKDEYLSYINKNHSIQYCQDGPLITLNNYNDLDNIRAICFIDDYDDTEIENLQHKNHILTSSNNPLWIFKNEKEIIIHIK